jgi:hypothetical protein
MSNNRLRVTRRSVQITLGLLWILDGALKFQPALLGSAFGKQVIEPVAEGQPGFVSWPVRETAGLVAHAPVAAVVAFGLIELVLGAGLLYGRTARWALGASIGWALAVWYLGEGLGGLFGGGASLLTGAPGSAPMYAIVAVTVWPARDGRSSGLRPALRPSRGAAAAWAALWLGGAILQLLPGADTNATLSMTLSMNASDAPGWLAALDNRLSWWVPWPGVSVILDLVILQAAIGLGVLGGRRTRQAAVIAGMVLSLAFWVTGQGLGEFWSGISTDPETGPLMVLLGVTVLGAVPWRRTAAAVRAPEQEREPARMEPALTAR